MNVILNESGTVQVTACFGHAGHAINPALLKLSQAEEDYLKSLLEEFTFDYILGKMRQQNSPEKSKLYYINKSDLRFEESCGKVQTSPWLPQRRRHDVFAHEEEQNPEDGIKVLNLAQDKSGRGFLAVIITPIQEQWIREFANKGIALDDTFNVTRYNLRLAALMVVDKKDRGLPGAFLLSNSMNTEDVKTLFEEVKKIVPMLNPKVFLSDEALSFYNGFKAVFSESDTNLLFCRFHILQTWLRKAKELVRIDLRDPLAKTLSELLRIADEAQFQNRLTELLSFLDQKGQSSFVEYLQRNYLGRISQWAGFQRQGLIFNTTMVAERWHGRLKSEHLHRNSNARADFLCDILIKAPQELAASYLIMDRRNLARPFRVRECNAAHRAAIKDYENNKELITNTGSGKWNVEALTSNRTFHVQTYSSSCPCDAKENLHCRACGVCPYKLRCTCGSAARSGISCAHMHAVAMYTDLSQSSQPVIDPAQPAAEPAQAEVEAAQAEVEPTQAEVERAHTARDSQDIQQVSSRERRMELWKSAEMSYTVVNDKIKRLVKLDTDETMESLKQIVERLEAVEVFAASVENGESGPSMAARPELTRQGAKPHLEPIRVERRSELKKRRAEERKKASEPVTVDPSLRTFCGICLLKDPELPPDMDPEEYEAQITEWLRCDNEGCKIWVHSACGRARPNRACTYCKTGQYSPCLE